jgi:hypothetical protein
MRYGKCLLAGVLVVAAASVLSPILVLIGLAIYNMVHSTPSDMAIGWNPVSLIKQPSVFLVALVLGCFLAGFLWEYRRLARTTRR